MAPIHLIVLNLVYDTFLYLAFWPVDKDFLKKPRIWKQSLPAFYGLVWSYLLCLWHLDLYRSLLYHHCPWLQAMAMSDEQCRTLHHALSNRLPLIHVVPNYGHHAPLSKLPFVQSQPALAVMATTLLGALFVTFTIWPTGFLLKVAPLNSLYFYY